MKNLFILFINGCILTLLLALWTDELECAVNPGIRPFEFLKIIGITILTLVVYGVFKSFKNLQDKLNNYSTGKQFTVITIITCLYLYLPYTVKVIENQMIDKELRVNLATKVKYSPWLAYGSKIDSMTISEYKIICRNNNFPKLPKEAKNINYSHSFDGFLPDYDFSLSYDLPLDYKVNIFKKGVEHQWYESQSVDTLETHLRVYYNEIVM